MTFSKQKPLSTPSPPSLSLSLCQAAPTLELSITDQNTGEFILVLLYFCFNLYVCWYLNRRRGWELDYWKHKVGKDILRLWNNTTLTENKTC